MSEDSDFTTLVLDLNTSIDVTGWQFENLPYNFINLFEFGYPSNFSGFKIRYYSFNTTYLTTTEIYFIRWMAITDDETLSDWSTSERLIIKR